MCSCALPEAHWLGGSTGARAAERPCAHTAVSPEQAAVLWDLSPDLQESSKRRHWVWCLFTQHLPTLPLSLPPLCPPDRSDTKPRALASSGLTPHPQPSCSFGLSPQLLGC